MNINKGKLYENFGDDNNKNGVSNLGITSCSVLGSKENIESNAGFFLLLIILVLFIIIFIIFCTKGMNLLENKIDEVIQKKFKNESKNKNNKNSLIKSNTQSSKKNQITNNNNKKKQKKNFNNKKKRFINERRDKNNHSRNISLLFQNNNNINNINKKNSSNNNYKPDTDYEINWLSYKEALRYDKRSNCDYYCALIKNKQLFIFTFCSFDDYNSGIVKKFMLFLSFALHYTANALFFTEDNMHQIYEDEGKFNFGYQKLNIILSAIISTFILRLMLQTLVLIDKDVLDVKKKSKKDLAIKTKKEKLKCMKIKFSVFFILNFILLGLFWYYLTCFNAIYKNTQIYLIENTFISFAFSLFYPFIINIFPTLIRMSSLHSSNKECFYKASQILQVI